MLAKQQNKLLLLLFVGVLMGALDIAIVGPALPAVQKQFGVDERSIAWIFSVYVLLNLAGTPLMAKLADTYGRRTLYIIAISLFAAGSLVVALAPSFSWLIIGRAIQGFGAGGIFPVASAVIGDTFPQERRGRALGLIGAVFGIAFIVGPILAGGLLLISWHWLFLINIPIAFIVIYMSFILMPDTKNAEHKRFDWAGITLLMMIISSLSFGFNQINSADIMQSLLSPRVWPFLLAALILLPLYRLGERRAQDPILRIQLLNSRQVMIVCLLALGAGITESALVFVPPYLVASFRVSNSQASFMLLPVVLSMAIGAPLAGRSLDRFGSRAVLITGTTLLTLGMLYLALEGHILLHFYFSACLVGIGMGFLLGAPLRYIMLNESRADERASAQGVLRLFTGIGQLLGAVLVGAVASSHGGGAAGLKIAYMMTGLMSLLLLLSTFGLKNRQIELATSSNDHLTNTN